MKNENKLKIIFLIPFFKIGGVERWVSYAQKALKSSYFEVEILCFGEISINEDYFCSGTTIKSVNLLYLIKLLFNKNVLIITALTKLNFVFAILGFLPYKHMSSIHLSLEKKSFESNIKYILRRLVHKIIGRYSNVVLCVSKGIESEFKDLCFNAKLLTVYNPCFSKSDIKLPRQLKTHLPIRFIAAGRLHHQKRFDILINSFLNSIPHLPAGSSLEIWGDGGERQKLSEMIPSDKKSIIKLCGSTDFLFEKYDAADVFVLSSEYEGFGNVLAEALARGCECISFDIPHGPKEILLDGKFGTLVPFSSSELTEALTQYASKNISRDFTLEERQAHLNKFTDANFATAFVAVIEDMFL